MVRSYRAPVNSMRRMSSRCATRHESHRRPWPWPWPAYSIAYLRCIRKVAERTPRACRTVDLPVSASSGRKIERANAKRKRKTSASKLASAYAAGHPAVVAEYSQIFVNSPAIGNWPNVLLRSRTQNFSASLFMRNARSRLASPPLSASASALEWPNQLSFALRKPIVSHFSGSDLECASSRAVACNLVRCAFSDRMHAADAAAATSVAGAAAATNKTQQYGFAGAYFPGSPFSTILSTLVCSAMVAR